MSMLIKFTIIKDIWSIEFIDLNPFTYIYVAGEGLWNSAPGQPTAGAKLGNLCPVGWLAIGQKVDHLLCFSC